MKIKRVELKNFKCFPDVILPKKEDTDLPDGLFLIQGSTPQKSNSFGKTSLVEGILFGFFGPKSVSLSLNDLITFDKENAELKIIFELDGIDYLLNRIIKRNKKSGSQIFKIFSKIQDKWKPDNSIDIEELLEIKREQALDTVFVKQGEIENLASAQPAKLRELIVKLFRLDIIKDAETYLNYLKNNNNRRINEINKNFISPSEIEKSIKKNSKQLIKNKSDLKDNQVELQFKEEKLKKLPDKNLLSKINVLKQVKEKLMGNMEVIQKDINSKLIKLKVEIDTDVTSLNKLIGESEQDISNNGREIDSIEVDLKKIRSEINKKKGIISQIKKSQNNINKNLKFEQGNQIINCPTCLREISYDDAQSIIDTYDKEIKVIKKEIDKLIPELNDFEKISKKLRENLDDKTSNLRYLKDLQKSKMNKIDVEERLKKNQSTYITLLKKYGVTSELELLRKFSVKNLENLRDKISSIESSLISLKQINKRIEYENLRVEKEILDWETKKEKMIELSKERDELDKKNIHVEKNKDLIKGFITEYMVEKRLITNIQYTTNKYLSNFTGGQYTNLDLFSVKKGGGIELQVFDEYNQTTKEIKFLSGGDRVALGFAMRIGISDLMRYIRPTKDSPKKNPKISFLILDEPLAALDKTRRMQVLTTLESQQDFNQIFLITHTDIPESVNPHLIKISKNFENGLSSAMFIPKEKKSEMLN